MDLIVYVKMNHYPQIAMDLFVYGKPNRHPQIAMDLIASPSHAILWQKLRKTSKTSAFQARNERLWQIAVSSVISCDFFAILRKP
jgi:hypothetical protein